MYFDKPKITPNDIPSIMHPYDLGEIISAEFLGGIPNSTFKITTNRKTLALRIYSIGQSSLRHIEIELDILKHLSNQNFISPRPIAGKDGKYLQYWGKYPLLATDFIEGNMANKQPFTPKLAYNTGALLNALQTSMKSFIHSNIPPDAYFFTKAEDVVSSIESDLHKRGWEMNISNVPIQWQRSSTKIKQHLDELNQEIIHCDFWPPNLKCQGDEIVGLMDFDDWTYGPVFLDLAYAFLECGMIGGCIINESIATELLKGYFQTNASLSELEQELFADAIEMFCCLNLAYNIVQADEYEQADIYRRRLDIFLDESKNNQFRQDISRLIRNL